MCDEDQRTPLMEACENNHMETVRYLLRAGACATLRVRQPYFHFGDHSRCFIYHSNNFWKLYHPWTQMEMYSLSPWYPGTSKHVTHQRPTIYLGQIIVLRNHFIIFNTSRHLADAYLERLTMHPHGLLGFLCFCVFCVLCISGCRRVHMSPPSGKVWALQHRWARSFYRIDRHQLSG